LNQKGQRQTQEKKKPLDFFPFSQKTAAAVWTAIGIKKKKRKRENWGVAISIIIYISLCLLALFSHGID
jgi:hypothetical protein